MTREQRPSDGSRELDLEQPCAEEPLELERSTPVGESSPAPQDTTSGGQPSANAGLELDSYPDPGRERAERREAALQQQMAERQARYQPPAEDPGSDLNIAKIIYVVIAAAVLAGGYYAFCRYKVGDAQNLFFMANRDLRDKVMASAEVPGVDDVRRIVRGMADEAGLELEAESIEIIVEPLADSKHIDKLDEEDKTKAFVYKGNWIVGHRTDAVARYGIVSDRFTLERFFYLHDFKAP